MCEAAGPMVHLVDFGSIARAVGAGELWPRLLGVNERIPNPGDNLWITLWIACGKPGDKLCRTWGKAGENLWTTRTPRPRKPARVPRGREVGPDVDWWMQVFGVVLGRVRYTSLWRTLASYPVESVSSTLSMVMQ